jgi:hypothetical protein
VKSLLFLTTSTLATNPRLVKEVEALKTENSCTVIYFAQTDWSAALTEQIIARNPEVNFIRIDRKAKAGLTILSKLTQKLAIVLNPLLKNKLSVAAFASNDKTFQLLHIAKRISRRNNFSSIIAHNLGAFYPAYKVAGKRSQLQLDIEDYHPGEVPYSNAKYETQNRKLIMQHLLPKAHHITYASPLIMKECLQLVSNSDDINAKSTVINNCFSQEEFKLSTPSADKMQWIWFSQNIAKGRGLEQLLPVLDKFSDRIQLHLIGNLYDDFKTEWVDPYHHLITVHPPQPQTQLNRMLSQFDVGLALEIESQDYNRQICLTNKIWAYFQAGLYIFASDTPAQQQFMETHNEHGKLSSLDSIALHETVQDMLKNKDEIRRQKAHRFEAVKPYAWEVEQEKLKSI